MRVGERSIYYILKCGVYLTETEYQSILNIDKDDTDKMAKNHSKTLSHVIRHGFEL